MLKVFFTKAAIHQNVYNTYEVKNNKKILFNFIKFIFSREEEDGEEYEGNERWEGYSMDLINEISKILHFQYRFEIVPDGK